MEVFNTGGLIFKHRLNLLMSKAQEKIHVLRRGVVAFGLQSKQVQNFDI